MKRKVRVKGPGVKLNNVWCYINEEAIIDEVQYEENRDYVEVIEEIEEPKIKSTQEVGTDIDVGTNEEKSPEKNTEVEDEGLEALKERAKKLGINVTHNMKKETIIRKIEKKEAEEDEKQNPGGEQANSVDKDVGTTTEENPEGE